MATAIGKLSYSLYLQIEPVAGGTVKVLSDVSHFTQQKPRNDFVAGVKVAALIGSAIATSAVAVPLGPFTIFARPAIQVLAVRVAVIGANILSCSVESYYGDRAFMELVLEPIHEKGKLEKHSFTVTVIAQTTSEVAWEILKPQILPSEVSFLVSSFAKGFVKTPVCAMTSYVGNCVYELRPRDILSTDVFKTIEISKILESETLKYISIQISGACVEYIEAEGTWNEILIIAGIGATLFSAKKYAKNAFIKGYYAGINFLYPEREGDLKEESFQHAEKETVRCHDSGLKLMVPHYQDGGRTTYTFEPV